MAKKKASFEEFLVTSINSQTIEQAKTTQNFVNALVNQKVAATGTTEAPAAKTTTRRSSTKATPAAVAPAAASSSVSISAAA